MRTQTFYTFDNAGKYALTISFWTCTVNVWEAVYICMKICATFRSTAIFFFCSTIKITYWQRHATQRNHILSLTKYGALAMIHTARRFSQFRLTTSFRCRYRTRILEQKTFSLAVKIMFLCCILYGSVLPSRFTTSRKKKEKKPDWNFRRLIHWKQLLRVHNMP